MIIAQFRFGKFIGNDRDIPVASHDIRIAKGMMIFMSDRHDLAQFHDVQPAVDHRTVQCPVDRCGTGL